MTIYGALMLDGWAGRSRQRIEVVRETPTRFCIRAITVTRLAGHSRYLQPGETALVPKLAVVIDQAGRDG